MARSIAGLAALAVALYLPWLGLRLVPSAGAFDLPVRLAGLDPLAHLSYGEILTGLGALALALAVAARGERTLGVRLAGWAVVAVAVVFLLGTRVGDFHGLFALRHDSTEYTSITRQFGYSSSALNPPSTFFGQRFDPTTTLLLQSLRPGWLLALLGGGLLAGRVPVAEVRRTMRSRGRATRWVTATVASGVVVATAASFALALQAQHDKANGFAALSAGHPRIAVSDLDAAARLNPSIRLDQDFETALGQAQLDGGDTGTPLALYTASQSTAGGNLVVEVDQLSRAHAADPGNLVIQAALDADLVKATSQAHIPAQVARADGRLADTAVAYTLGHFTYSTDPDQAIRYLEAAYADTANLNVRSSCLTLMALAEQRLGDSGAFRADLLAAVRDDPFGYNSFAREISTGLFTPQLP